MKGVIHLSRMTRLLATPVIEGGEHRAFQGFFFFLSSSA